MISQNAVEKSAQLLARLERLPFSRWHKTFFILAFCGIVFDAVDFALFGAALPPVAHEFGLGPAQSGLLATVGLIGAFVGALFWGTLSDYIGRRTAFQTTACSPCSPGLWLRPGISPRSRPSVSCRISGLAGRYQSR